jgi:hypothetical protein
MQFYPKVEKFVEESFYRLGNLGDGDPEMNIRHLKQAAYWLKQIKPDADEAMLVAALGHDIERAYRDDKLMESLGWYSPAFYKLHQEKGAEIIGKFLIKQGATEEFVARTKNFIEHHEFGGTDDQNLVKDADCLSFLENNIPFFLDKKVKQLGKEKVKSKFDDMMNRITSEKAKAIANPRYEEAIKKLGY